MLNRIIFLILFLSYVLGGYAQNTKLADSLQKELQFTKQDSNLVFLYKNLIHVVKKNGDLDKARDLNEDLFKQLPNTNYSKGYAYFYLNQGDFAGVGGRYDSACFYFDMALQYLDEKKDSELYLYILGFKAKGYERLGKISEAIKILRQVNSVYRYTIKDTSSVYYSGNLSALGWIYLGTGRTDSATNYASQLLRLGNRTDDLIIKREGEELLGDILTVNKDYTQAKLHMQRALEIQRRISKNIHYGSLILKTAQISMILNENPDLIISKYKETLNYFSPTNYIDQYIAVNLNIAQMYKRKEQVDSAVKYLKIVFEVSKKSKDVETITKGLTSIGEAFMLEGQYSKAILNYHEARQLARENHLKIIEIGTLKLLFEAERMQNNFKESLSYYEQYIQQRDTLFNKEKSKQISDLEFRYETEKKNLQIKLLTDEKTISQLKIKQRNYTLIGTIGILILGGLFGLLFVRQQKLNQAKKTSQLEQKLLRTQMNPHFISNCMAVIQNMVMNKKPLDATKLIGKFGNLTRQILHSSREDYIPLKQEISLLHDYLDFQQLSYPDLFDYSINISGNLDLDEVSIPPMFIQPFVENAIEHGIKPMKTKGKLIINIKNVHDYLVVNIRDNGKGINIHAETLSSPESNKSYSIQITKERIEMIQSKLKRNIDLAIKDLKESGESGTEVELILPFFDT